MYQVFEIKALQDNYIWALVQGTNCVIVDPGQSQPVLDFLIENNLTLTDILLTHHHPDHVAGVEELTTEYPNTQVYGPNTARFKMVNFPCQQGTKVTLNAGIELTVIELPGHTIDHIAYHDDTNAFVGDTLFSGGCGRLFEGTPKQMLNSLNKLSQLPANTKVYCAHEYTQANLAFAKAAEQSNQQLELYITEVSKKREQNQSTIPTTIGQELKINPFLRSNKDEIKRTIQQEFDLGNLPTTEESFALLRKWKDNF